MKLPLRIPITLFVKVVGTNGRVHELQAVVDPSSTHTVISYYDAMLLDYDVVYEPRAGVGKGALVVTAGCLIEAPLVTLQEVSIGDLVVKNVEAVVYNLPSPSGVDMILGANFLKSFRLIIDYKEGSLTIE